MTKRQRLNAIISARRGVTDLALWRWLNRRARRQIGRLRSERQRAQALRSVPVNVFNP